MENANPKYFILGGECLSLYGIDLFHSKEKSFIISNKNKKKGKPYMLVDPSYQYTKMKRNLKSQQSINMNKLYKEVSNNQGLDQMLHLTNNNTL